MSIPKEMRIYGLQALILLNINGLQQMSIVMLKMWIKAQPQEVLSVIALITEQTG